MRTCDQGRALPHVERPLSTSLSEPLKPTHKPSVCFVALRAYNVLSGRSDINHTGGAEVQQVQIATWLARRAYQVSFVTLDYGQPDGVDLDGVKVFSAYSEDAGIHGLRFVHPRWSGLWGAMARADADVYYQRCAGCETGQVGMWCRLHRRKFVFAAANDSDCDASLYALTSRRERALYRAGVRLADVVTAQTRTQQSLLRQNMGVEAVVVRNCARIAGDQAPRRGPASDDGGPVHVLWVGRISEQKRLEWLLDVADRCRDILFDVVGAPNEPSGYSSSLIKRAASVRNVRMCGRVRYAEMVDCYRRSDILCSTSAYEGFPNTFLEAWGLGIPVVSTFDPDGVIAAHGLGWVARDREEIVALLERIRQTPELLAAASIAAKQYYLANHTPEVCLPVLEHLLLDLAGR